MFIKNRTFLFAAVLIGGFLFTSSSVLADDDGGGNDSGGGGENSGPSLPDGPVPSPPGWSCEASGGTVVCYYIQ